MRIVFVLNVALIALYSVGVSNALTCACFPPDMELCSTKGDIKCPSDMTVCFTAKKGDDWKVGCVYNDTSCNSPIGKTFDHCKTCPSDMCNKDYFQGAEHELGKNGAASLGFFAPVMGSIILVAFA